MNASREFLAEAPLGWCLPSVVCRNRRGPPNRRLQLTGAASK